MHDFYRGMEIVLYAVLNFLPYLILALYPFRGSLRCSRVRIILLSILVLMIQTGLLLWAVIFFSYGRGILSAISTTVYFIFYFWVVKAHPGKILFTLLMLSNIADFVVVCSKCIEGQIFPVLARQQYRWSFSVVMNIYKGCKEGSKALGMEVFVADSGHLLCDMVLSSVWQREDEPGGCPYAVSQYIFILHRSGRFSHLPYCDHAGK